MQVLFLYVAVVLIWGSTWAAIAYQLGPVAEEVSVAYRFAIAAVALYLYALVTGGELRLPRDKLGFVFVQGTLLFCLNYFFVYYGTEYITTGLVAVLFTTIVVFNAVFERLFFRRPVDARVLMAALLGLVGIAFIFWPEIAELSLEDDALLGVVLVTISVVIASLGNMAAIVNTSRGLPVVAVNAHGMAFASVLSAVLAAALGREFNFSLETGYVTSLVYLAILGSAVAFGIYLALIRRIGAARASYSTVLFPIVALAISTVIEDYRWTAGAGIGILLTLVGNYLVLSRQAPQPAKPEQS